MCLQNMLIVTPKNIKHTIICFYLINETPKIHIFPEIYSYLNIPNAQ